MLVITTDLGSVIMGVATEIRDDDNKTNRSRHRYTASTASTTDQKVLAACIPDLAQSMTR